jgi:GAF domain-containing protein
VTVRERELTLDAEPVSAPTARRFVRAALSDTDWEDESAAAELVVTELVTNAVLHGCGPIAVRLHVAGHLYIGVRDSSLTLPVRPVGLVEGMTGRGLLLIDAITSRWWVQEHAFGKTVWACLGADAEGDETVDGWEDGPERAFRELPRQVERPSEYEVKLNDVPTDLLVAAKSHVDNVVRELALVGAGAHTGQSGQISPRVASMVTTMAKAFAQPREEIKQQAIAAALTGEKRTRLVLHLPLTAAAAGREYLRALDEADSHARAARLLVFEEPPEHRSFRRWYVTAVIDQLDAIAAGRPVPVVPTLESHLLGELRSIAAAHRQADRSARLQTVTASLAAARNNAEIANVVVAEGVTAMRASSGQLLAAEAAQPPAGGRDTRDRTASPEAATAHSLPITSALEHNTPVWVESRAELVARFPALAASEPDTVSVCAVPLCTGDTVVAALSFSFAGQRLFDSDERAFVSTLAAQTALTLERARLYEVEQRARSQAECAATLMRRLHEVISAVASHSSVRDVADAIALEACQSLGARTATLWSLEHEERQLTMIGMHGVSSEIMARWSLVSLDDDMPICATVRRDEPVVINGPAQLAEQYPHLVEHLHARSVLVCVPLSAGERRLGALSLTFATGRIIEQAEVDLLTTLATQCVLALDRSTSLTAEREARRSAAFLADAGSVLASSLENEDTLRHLVSLSIENLADWAVIYLFDGNKRISAATAEHRDPVPGALLRRLLKDRDPEPSSEIAGVITSGSLRVAAVSEEIRQRTVAHPDLAVHADAVMPTSALAVRLATTHGVVGVLALFRVDGPPYTADEQVLAEQLASRGAVAIDNARNFHRERDTAVTLQRSLLPQEPPRVPGVRFAWRYLPAGAGSHVGGDWYDAVPVAQGRVALLIGDVMGRGVQAAAVMGQLRAMARALLGVDASPAQVLTRLDLALPLLEGDHLATAAIALLDPAKRTLTLASAGHLPPLLVRADGTTTFIRVEPGPPLGVGNGTFVERRLQLPADSTVLFYTDGLVEGLTLPVDDGMRLLAEASAGSSGPEGLCDVALRALGRDKIADDDTALLAVGID